MPAERIHVIPCGLASQPPVPAADEVMKELQLARAQGLRVIFCIGSVTTNKNQQLLLEALPAVGRAHALKPQQVLGAFDGIAESAVGIVE